MAFPLLNVIISEAWGQCHFAVSGEICEHGLWGRGGKYMLSVQVWHTRVCTAGRKLPCRARMDRGEWARLPMVSGSLCGSFLWHEHLRWCSVGRGCPPILATLPELNGRQGEHWEQLPSLESAGSGWGWLTRSFDICHLLMWKLPFLPECTFLSHGGF